MTDDLYETLGVKRDASPDEIKRRYRTLAKELHPDLNPDKPDVAARFSEVTAAYDILSDPEKRSQYDRGEIDAKGHERPQQGFYRDFADAPGGAKYYRQEGFPDDASLMQVMTDVAKVQPQQLVEVTCEGDRFEILLVEWLNALTFEMATNKMLFSRFIVTIDDGKLMAQAWGEPIDFLRHELIIEVKGATQTKLKVEPEPDGRWVAQCVIDV